MNLEMVTGSSAQFPGQLLTTEHEMKSVGHACLSPRAALSLPGATVCTYHFTVYTNVRSLCCIPETNRMLYVSYISINEEQTLCPSPPCAEFLLGGRKGSEIVGQTNYLEQLSQPSGPGGSALGSRDRETG